MKFSVITPCYNSAAYLPQAIESILTQKGDFELEYIVVDGKSTDETSQLLQRYKEAVDAGKWGAACGGITMKVISETDSGMYDALAKGLRLATGNIISYLNADDLYLPNAFATLAEIFQAYPEISWVTGMKLEYNEKGHIISCVLPYTFYSKFIQVGAYGTCLPFIMQESTFWRKELLDHLDYDRLRRFRYAGDYYLWHTFSHQADLFVVKSALGGFRYRPNQLSSQKNNYMEEFKSIAKEQSFFDKLILYVHRKRIRRMSERKKYRMKKLIYYNGNRWMVKV